MSSKMETNNTDSRTKTSLRGQSSRIFIPKGNRVPPPQEFKIEFMLSQEKTIILRVTRESNPLKLADYVLDQAVAISKERGEELPQQQKGKVVKGQWPNLLNRPAQILVPRLHLREDCGESELLLVNPILASRAWTQLIVFPSYSSIHNK